MQNNNTNNSTLFSLLTGAVVGLHNMAAMAVSQSMALISSESRLRLENNKLSQEDIARLQELLPHTNITSLDLNINENGPEGAAALAALLPAIVISRNRNHLPLDDDGYMSNDDDNMSYGSFETADGLEYLLNGVTNFEGDSL